MKRSVLALLPLLALGLATVHCDGDDPPSTPTADAGPPDVLAPEADASNPEGFRPSTVDPPLVLANKVDLLFVVDNSATMEDKQTVLAGSVGRVLKALPVKDMHVGVISSSLANGGDICTSTNPRADDKAHLLNKTLAGAVVAGAEKGFLTFGAGGIADVAVLEQRAAELVVGVGQSGCGHESTLEAMYRFVAQPDPSTSIVLDSAQQAKAEGVDYELLAQRKAFFRPDSAVVIVMITDEDDASVDPRAIGGFGYAFSARNFPGSNVTRGSTAQGTTAPRGTSICATDPQSPACTSCGFAATCDQNVDACKALRADANCKLTSVAGQTGQGFDGFFGPTDDDLNVRMTNMKQRFGVEPRYAIDRYVAGLARRGVPSRATEHVEKADAIGGRLIADYQQAETCQNPLFATGLPEREGDELCALADNGRSSRLVFFGLLGGVPAADLAPQPDWVKILGSDPSNGKLDGIDPHMLVSVAPRAALTAAGDPSSPRGQNGNDAVHGREWNTQKKDLQYACTLALPTPRDCSSNADVCDCSNDPVGGVNPNPPLCKEDGSPVQTRAKAYPTVRELQLAKALGDRAVVASLCAPDNNAIYGAFFDALTGKINGTLKPE